MGAYTSKHVTEENENDSESCGDTERQVCCLRATHTITWFNHHVHAATSTGYSTDGRMHKGLKKRIYRLKLVVTYKPNTNKLKEAGLFGSRLPCDSSSTKQFCWHHACTVSRNELVVSSLDPNRHYSSILLQILEFQFCSLL